MSPPSSSLTPMSQVNAKRSNIPAMVGAIGVALTTGGPTYAFGLYGAALKQNLGLSQGDLDTISTAFFVAGLLSWAPGLFADRFGARLAICIGGCTGCTSLLLYWCIAKEYIVIPSHAVLVTSLSLLGIFTFESSAMVTGSVFKVLTVTAGPSKGPAVGVAKGLVGLGSGAYTCMFESIKTSNESDLDFLPLAAFLFFTCATLPGFMLIPSRKELQSTDNFTHDAQPWHFRAMYCGLIGMGLLVIWDSLAALISSRNDDDSGDVRGGGDSGKSPWTAIVLFALWWGPLVAIYCSHKQQQQRQSMGDNDDDHRGSVYQTIHSQDEEDDDSNQQESANDGDESTVESAPADEPEATTDLLLADNHHGNGATTATRDGGVPNPPVIMAHTTAIHPDRTLFQMLQTPEAYCFLWSSTIMVGSGTVETNNMGQMTEALSLPSAVTPASMALFSVAQAAARVVTGAASEYTLQKYGWPRPVYLVFAAGIGAGAHFMLGWATGEVGFVLGVALSGINFGMVWPLLVLCSGEIFGASHVGANYLFYDGFSSAAGTLLLSKFIAQDVYEHHIDPATSPDAFTCLGTDCFRSTHFIIAIFCLTCVFSSVAFVVLTKDVYKPVMAIETAVTDAEEEEESGVAENGSNEPSENVEMESPTQ
uniref:Nodulin-like domain-containing protein n=1 Tax=Amphora coffeiformis TaxID=265554 RepID=A0A7S3KZU3_9STRA